MRSIVLFQTIANIVLAVTVIFLIHQIDRKVEEIAGVERIVAKTLTEAATTNATLAEILAVLRASEAVATPSSSVQ